MATQIRHATINRDTHTHKHAHAMAHVYREYTNKHRPQTHKHIHKPKYTKQPMKSVRQRQPAMMTCVLRVCLCTFLNGVVQEKNIESM